MPEHPQSIRRASAEHPQSIPTAVSEPPLKPQTANHFQESSKLKKETPFKLEGGGGRGGKMSNATSFFFFFTRDGRKTQTLSRR